MNHYKKLPPGAFKCLYEAEMYLLKPRKKVMYEENREPFVGLRYLIYSFYSRVYFERVVDSEQVEENVEHWVGRGLIWLWPTERNKDTIREQVEKAKKGYYPLMRLRQAEIDHQRHILTGNKGDGHKTKNRLFRQIRYKK